MKKKVMKLLMGTKRQFKMYLDEELVERLKRAAEKIGKSSGQEVAEEVLSVYLPVWSSVNDATRRAIDYQTQTISNEKVVKSVREEDDFSHGTALAPHSKTKIPIIQSNDKVDEKNKQAA